MWSASLQSFFFLFTLKLFVAVGNAHPITDVSDIELSKANNIMTPVTTYTCVYIPSNLELCQFISYKSRENLRERKLLENKKRKLESNKIYFTSHTSMRAPGTKKFQKQPFVKTIIYKIQRCVPPRLPFNLPWCTNEDLSDKNSVIYEVYPFMIRDYSKETYEFPMYDDFKQAQTIPKSA